MRRLFEKKAGAKRVQRLLAKGNKMAARGEVVPSSLMGAFGGASLKLQRRIERNPQYAKEVARRAGLVSSDSDRNKFFADLARGIKLPKS